MPCIYNVHSLYTFFLCVYIQFKEVCTIYIFFCVQIHTPHTYDYYINKIFNPQK